MQKRFKRILTTILLIVLLVIATASTYATTNLTNETKMIQAQAQILINSVDEESLLKDASENKIDYSVPRSIRENILFSSEFSPFDGVKYDAVQLRTSSTVQKVGEIVAKSGDVSNLYVAVVVATDVKVDDQYSSNYGVKAWATVYWIDNFGANNELYAAGADWDSMGNTVGNRQVRYGTTDIFWATWINGPTTKYPTSNSAYYQDSSYSGLTLRCQSKIDVINVGTVTCNVGSRAVTK